MAALLVVRGDVGGRFSEQRGADCEVCNPVVIDVAYTQGGSPVVFSRHAGDLCRPEAWRRGGEIDDLRQRGRAEYDVSASYVLPGVGVELVDPYDYVRDAVA